MPVHDVYTTDREYRAGSVQKKRADSNRAGLLQEISCGYPEHL